jgi:hypothetical protein
MSRVKIVCLCVTENRADCFPIALASWLEQELPDEYGAQLLVLDRSAGPRTLDAVQSVTSIHDAHLNNIHYINTYRAGRAYGLTVAQRLTWGARFAFDDLDADLVTMWDDDDWSPPDRLRQTAELFVEYGGRCCFIGYREGFFVNARTWQGEQKVLDHFWGSSLTFSRGLDLDLLANGPWPGYDRAFVAGHPTVPQHELLAPEVRPIAFSHGRNVATFLAGPGFAMEPRLRKWLGPKSLAAASDFREFLIKHRVYPPQP